MRIRWFLFHSVSVFQVISSFCKLTRLRLLPAVLDYYYDCVHIQFNVFILKWYKIHRTNQHREADGTSQWTSLLSCEKSKTREKNYMFYLLLNRQARFPPGIYNRLMAAAFRYRCVLVQWCLCALIAASFNKRSSFDVYFSVEKYMKSR